MVACTFFGHRDCPEAVKLKLKEVLVELIAKHHVEMFYVGNHGQFDSCVRTVLRELKSEYPQINYAVVLAYVPDKKTGCDDASDTLLPNGMESIHPHYAIPWRNNWMLHQSDYVVTYITRSWGGAVQYVNKAKRQGKAVISISPD